LLFAHVKNKTSFDSGYQRLKIKAEGLSTVKRFLILASSMHLVNIGLQQLNFSCRTIS